MKSMKLLTLGTALLTVSLVCSSQAQTTNICGNATTPPKIITSAVLSPQLESQGIEYVAGDAVRVQLVTDGCTDIQSIRVGSTTLTPQMPHSGTLPNYYWYSSIDTQINQMNHGRLIWVGFPPIADGSTDEVAVTVVRSSGTGTSEFAFPLVHVSLIQPGADAAIGISGTELHNKFAVGLHDFFSDPNNSTVVSGTTVDYDPTSLETFIDSTGIWFAFRLKAETTCKPIVSVTGTFVVDTNRSTGLVPRWVNPVSVNPEVTWCVLADALLHGIEYVVTVGLYGDGSNINVGLIQKMLTQFIQQSFPDLSKIAPLLDGTTTQNDEFLINLKGLSPAVEIDVPYSPFDTTRTATRFPPGEVLGLVANGLGMGDFLAGKSNEPLQSGPDGVPEQTPTTLSNEYTVARTGALLLPAAPVGLLLARFPGARSIGAPGDVPYSPGCELTVPAGTEASGPAEILFGVNDTTADAQRLRTSGALGYKVRIVFGFGGSPCSTWVKEQ
jgi:hypothetical protein